MKTKDLIKHLQELDPTGECQVFCNGDIYFGERLPWYYDGKPGILTRDKSKAPYYDITGMRQITAEDGDKIYLHSMGLDDLAHNEVDGFVTNIIEGSDKFKNKYQKHKDAYLIEMYDEEKEKERLTNTEK